MNKLIKGTRMSKDTWAHSGVTVYIDSKYLNYYAEITTRKGTLAFFTHSRKVMRKWIDANK